ncbi:MAG: hypothetical protein ACFFD4_38745, partial [Candidatus Odinarchaeota archaeon]
MNSIPVIDQNTVKKQKQFYLLTVDLLQGLVLFPMIIGHGILWWNPTSVLDFSNWENNSFLITATIVTGLLVFPCFVFLYGFNQVNSLLRKSSFLDFHTIRTRIVKKSLAFFLIALLSQAIMAAVSAPEKLLNYVLTWQLFHLFGLSALILLVLFELACWLEQKTRGKVERRLILHCFLGTFL